LAAGRCILSWDSGSPERPQASGHRKKARHDAHPDRRRSRRGPLRRPDHPAIDLALATQPDVVVLDYSLPLVNGVEATRQIRSRVPGIEVLIFTMHDTDSLVRDVLEAGARGFLLKSDAKALLVSAVETLAAHRPFFTGKVSEALLETYLAKGCAHEAALTAREKAVVQLIAEGRTNKQIADILSISTKTVETHRALALRKLNLDTTAALIRYAIRNKLVEA
jgi:DNA-binding NarL/FixJ family response regulator